jgi:hypothetical protein
MLPMEFHAASLLPRAAGRDSRSICITTNLHVGVGCISVMAAGSR